MRSRVCWLILYPYRHEWNQWKQLASMPSEFFQLFKVLQTFNFPLRTKIKFPVLVFFLLLGHDSLWACQLKLSPSNRKSYTAHFHARHKQGDREKIEEQKGAQLSDCHGQPYKQPTLFSSLCLSAAEQCDSVWVRQTRWEKLPSSYLLVYPRGRAAIALHLTQSLNGHISRQIISEIKKSIFHASSGRVGVVVGW